MATVHELNSFQKAGIAVAVALFRLWASTWRIRITDSARMFFEGRANSQIALLWHNRLAMALAGKIRYGQRLRFCGLVSPSRDGAMLSEILKQVGVVPVRGSSTRRAVESTRELIDAIEKQNLPAAITPDGPLGPVYQLKDGLRALVERYRTGILILSTSDPIELKSWDKFQIPRLFARVEIDFVEISSDWERVVEQMEAAAK